MQFGYVLFVVLSAPKTQDVISVHFIKEVFSSPGKKKKTRTRLGVRKKYDGDPARSLMSLA